MILIFISVEFFDNFIITSGFLDRQGRHGRISYAAQGRQETLHRLFPLPVITLLLLFPWLAQGNKITNGKYTPGSVENSVERHLTS